MPSLFSLVLLVPGLCEQAAHHPQPAFPRPDYGLRLAARTLRRLQMFLSAA
jgi:hypothetical protein